ncbi:MAG TPA: dihydrolipoamide acetyltransferase family protein [Bacteroidota bacterium]|nr:dihydrolipoamide acetyltransferase family protein [Bacteroidota bacterium]
MQVDVVMPKMGESIQEGKILRWTKKPGEKVQKDETILEISTDKVDSEIPSPATGILTKILVPEQETVAVGTVIAVIETDVAAAKVDSSTPSAPTAKQSATPAQAPQVHAPAVSTVVAEEKATARSRNGERFYSPLVRTIAKKEGIAIAELEAIPGSGLGGRVTKKDILAYLTTRTSRGAAVPSYRPEVHLKPVDEKELLKKYPAPKYKVVQMDNVQLKMAEHMVRSVATSPHVAAVSECDCTRMVNFRNRNAERFEKQEGFRLTYTHFIADAVVQALKEFPLINSSVEGDKIILKNFINLGLAVASPSGLIVPVIKNAEEKNFLGLARAINDIAVKTRNRKLMPDDIQGGTFTVTNYGVFGTVIGTPIINQPQVAILGVGAIKKRPVVITDEEGNDSIGIRSIAILTLSFDHRIIDGEMGGKFLEKVIANIQDYDFSKVF